MSHYVYSNLSGHDTELVKELIGKAKSDSGISGAELRKVHFKIGEELGKVLSMDLDVNDTVILTMLTGAIPFAMGIGNAFDCKILFFDSHLDAPLPEIQEKTIILADEVINSGKTILRIADHYAKNHQVILATTVMPDSSEALVSSYDIYTFRISTHRYKGEMTRKRSGNKGPDTAARLYSLLK